MQRINFDPKNENHVQMLSTVKNYMAIFLPKKTIDVIKVGFNNLRNDNDKTNDGAELEKLALNTFEKDIFEAIGFQNGNKPHTDIR